MLFFLGASLCTLNQLLVISTLYFFYFFLAVAYLMFANRQNISRMQLNGSDVSTLINATVNAIALDYDYRYKLLH